MQKWKPKRTPGRWIGIAILVILLAGAAFFATRLILALSQPPSQWNVNLGLYGDIMAMVLLIILAGMVLYRVLAVFTMVYEVDRNGIYILWLGNRAVIPMDAVEFVDSGDAQARMPWRYVQGIGYYWGQGRTGDEKLLHLFSTLPPSQSLLLHTASTCYAISPEDTDGFVQHLEQRRRIGAVKPLSPTYERGRILFYAFWHDRVVRWALLLSLLLNLLLLGILFARYPYLADTLEMRFNAAGEVTELRPRHQVLFLPLAAIGLSLLNTGLGLAFYRHEQTGARLLQITSVLMPVLFGVAVFAIILR
jgi:hypothetical protein